MGFLDYLGIGAALGLVILSAVMIFVESRKYRPPQDWNRLRELVFEVLWAIFWGCLALSALAVGAGALAGFGWAFVQLLKLLGLMP